MISLIWHISLQFHFITLSGSAQYLDTDQKKRPASSAVPLFTPSPSTPNIVMPIVLPRTAWSCLSVPLNSIQRQRNFSRFLSHSDYSAHLCECSSIRPTFDVFSSSLVKLNPFELQPLQHHAAYSTVVVVSNCPNLTLFCPICPIPSSFAHCHISSGFPSHFSYLCLHV